MRQGGGEGRESRAGKETTEKERKRKRKKRGEVGRREPREGLHRQKVGVTREGAEYIHDFHSFEKEQSNRKASVQRKIGRRKARRCGSVPFPSVQPKQ